MGNLNYDASVAPPSNVVPKGVYTLLVEDSDVKDTKAGTGKIIRFTFQVIEGEYNGRKIFVNLNYINPNKQAEAIGRRLLHSLCHASGYTGTVSDTSQLHGKIVLGSVVVERDDTYGDKNNIKNFDAAGPQTSAMPQGVTQQSVPQCEPLGATQAVTGAATGAQKAPWDA